jgi:hypothetical protein
MSLSPRCAARSRRLRVLIILAGQRVWVLSGMHGLGSCATPGVLELGGKASETPLAHVVVGPQRNPHAPSSEIIAAPLVASRLLALASPSLRGRGEKTMATTSYRLSLLPSRHSCPGQPPVVSGTG